MLHNDAASEVRLLESQRARSHAEFGDLIQSSRTRQRVYVEGDVEGGTVSFGPGGAFADEIVPAARIVERLMRATLRERPVLSRMWPSRQRTFRRADGSRR